MDPFLGRPREAQRLPAALSRAPGLSGPVQRARAPSVTGDTATPESPRHGRTEASRVGVGGTGARWGGPVGLPMALLFRRKTP